MHMKYLFSMLTFLVAVGTQAQEVQKYSPAPASLNVKATKTPAAFTPADLPIPIQEAVHPLTYSGVQYRDIEEVVGSTYWDAQTYGCIPSRVYYNQNNEPVVNWLYTQETSAHSDRGMARNVRSGGTWGTVTAREEAIRTGFPSAAKLSDGTEVAVSHATGFTPNRLHFLRREPSASAWTETDLPQPAGIGLLWPQIAIGGPDGKTVHVIGITVPVANTGVVYEGINGHVLYWRSLDGGVTWDISSKIIAGCDNTNFELIGAMQYKIDASANTVAFGVFEAAQWADLLIWKSTDNGTNFTQQTVLDFPDAVEDFESAPGNIYTIDDIGGADPFAPDSLAILTCDGQGTMLVDDNGEVHVWFGRMYVVDNEYSDSTSSYYPGTNGMVYWKESFGVNNMQIIAGALDYNGNGFIDLTTLDEIARYGASGMCSMPSVGVDADGVIYLAYRAIHELYKTGSSADKDQFYSHIYLIKSTDGGNNWGEPHDLTTETYVPDPSILFITEAVQPMLPRAIGAVVGLAYVQDFTPGMNFWGANHPIGENFITWVDVNKDSIPVFIVDTYTPVGVKKLEISIAPNPVSDILNISAVLPGAEPARIQVIDMTGRVVLEQYMAAAYLSKGNVLPIAQLQPGVYQVVVTQKGYAGTQKVVKI